MIDVSIFIGVKMANRLYHPSLPRNLRKDHLTTRIHESNREDYVQRY